MKAAYGYDDLEEIAHAGRTAIIDDNFLPTPGSTRSASARCSATTASPG